MTPAAEIGRATAAHQFYRNLGFTLGAAVGGVVLLTVVAGVVGDVEAVQQLLAGSAATTDLETTAAIADGYAASVVVGSVVALAALVPFRWVGE